MEYLGFWVNQNGIRMVNKKLDAMVKMMPPNNKHEVIQFIVLVNYYRYMWDIRSHLLCPLTTLTSDNVTFKWTDVEQKAFEEIKCIVSRDTLLSYLYINKKIYSHRHQQLPDRSSDYSVVKPHHFLKLQTNVAVNTIHSNGKVIAQNSQNFKGISDYFIGSTAKNIYIP